MLTLLVEGWRFFPQSFSIVNQFQCLEILKRSDVRLVHRDAPPAHPKWLEGRQPRTGPDALLGADEAEALARIPPPGNESPDAVFRIYYPYEFSAAPRGRTFVFAVTGMGRIPRFMVRGKRDPADALAGQDVTLVTPSRFSRQSLVASGADPDRIAVVPHGVDTRIFRPASAERRSQLRREFGWEGRFVFLNVGAQYWWKGGLALAKAFSVIAGRHPQAVLALKGLDDVYASRAALEELARQLGPKERAALEGRVAYIGGTLPFARVADLYRAADALVAPYLGEGFYLPALEAIACGLPVICTKGGPTDDFLRDDFALRIESRLSREVTEKPRLNVDIGHLVALMDQATGDEGLAARARRLGPPHVAANYTWTRVTDRLLRVMTGAVSLS